MLSQICFQKESVQISSITLRNISSPPDVHKMCGSVSVPAAGSWDENIELFGRLDRSNEIQSPSRKSCFYYDFPPAESRMENQLGKKRACSESSNAILGHGHRLEVYDCPSLSRACFVPQAMRRVVRKGAPSTSVSTCSTCSV